ncbi:hypothetical protein OKW41_002480 [Paraburkholderia sp. UCT70]
MPRDAVVACAHRALLISACVGTDEIIANALAYFTRALPHRADAPRATA